MITPANILKLLADSGEEEIFIPLLERAGFWYDQANDEWVLHVHGEAVLEFPDESITLNAGDYLLLPANKKHRAASNSQDALWLALHVNE